MAVSTGYDYGIRSGLVGKGVDPSSISYDQGRGYVTVGGKDFIKADKVFNGSSFTNQQKFNNAWNAYNTTPTVAGSPGAGSSYAPTSYPSPTTGVSPTGTASQQPTPAPTPSPMDTYNQHLQTIDQLMNQQVDPNAIYASPEYAAYQAQAAKQSQAATRQAQEAYGASGFGRSYALGERAQGIQNDANAYLNTQVLPQLMAQSRADQQQKIQNEYGLVDQAWNQVNRGDTLDQNAQSNAIQKGQLTGFYQSPEMKAQYDIVDQAKQDYALAKTPEERAAAHQRAAAARAELERMNANAGIVGSDVTLDQARANSGKYGVQTLEGQRTAYDMSQDNPANQAQLISNKIDQLKLDNLPEQTKLELEQLKQQVSAGKIDVQTAEHNLKELTDPNSVTNKTKKLTLEMTQLDAKNYPEESRLKLEQLRKTVEQIGKEPAVTENEKAMQGIELEKARIELQNLQNGTPDKAVTADDMRTYFDSMVQRDPDTNAITNPTDLESSILNSALSDYDVYQMYLRYGLKWQGDIPKPGK